MAAGVWLRLIPLALLVHAALSPSVDGQQWTPVFKPFELDHQAPPGGPADLRGLLTAPAGRHGYVMIRDGLLADGGGRRLRLWGVNLSFSGSLPAHEHAARYADLLAKYGINCVRVHHADRAWPRGLIDDSGGDSRKLHPEALDRLDYFVYQLKQRGVYVDLNLNVSRQFLPGDGVKDADKIGYAKALTYFDPVLIRLQKEYARQLLTHYNPYTDSEYRSEPAVAIVEMVNENSLIEAWVRGRLRGRQTKPIRTTWTDIPPSYERDLTRRYNEWLAGRSPELAARLKREAGVEPDQPLPRLQPEQFAKASAERFRTEAEFYMALERQYFLDMKRYLKEELGVRPLLIGTSSHSGSLSPWPLLSSTSLLDIVDGHTYWQHPSYRRDPDTGRVLSWTIRNTPMVNDPLHGTVQALARNAVSGKPYTVSEVNHPYPSEYAAEGIPILAAYAALQDWDGVFWYSFAHVPPAEWRPGPTGFFDIRNDPVKMAQLAAGALIFLRGDVDAARQLVERSVTREEMIESLRTRLADPPWLDPHASPALPLIHRTRIASFDRPPTPYAAPNEDPIRADTGQLAWGRSPRGQGLVAIDSPRSQGLVGFVGEHPEAQTRNLRVALENPFCAVTLHSLDEKPIAKAERLLLVTGARVAASGMKWDEQHRTLLDEGGPPMQIEAVVGTVTLRGLEGARRVLVSALDGAGRPGEARTLAVRDGEVMIDLTAKEASPWRIIDVRR